MHSVFDKQKLLKIPLSIFLDLGLNNKKACFTMMWPAPDSKGRVIPVRNTEFYDIDGTYLEASLVLMVSESKLEKVQVKCREQTGKHKN